jgi:hypothetical protein
MPSRWDRVDLQSPHQYAQTRMIVSQQVELDDMIYVNNVFSLLCPLSLLAFTRTRKECCLLEGLRSKSVRAY